MLAFYQTTSALFVGLLVAVLLRARHLDGGPTAPLTSGDKRRASLVAFVSLAMVFGEIASLLALFNAHATGLEHAIVGIAMLIAILGTAPPAVFTVLGGILGEDARRLVFRLAVWGTAAAIGAGALFAAYRLGATSGRVPTGSLNAPHAYQVYGTCASGGCGLNERKAPTPYAQKLGSLQDGMTVHVICQTLGYPLSTNHHTSRIWDQLASAAYISDLFVSTPTTGKFAPELSRCPTQPITSGTQG
jgi:hypothetical protein